MKQVRRRLNPAYGIIGFIIIQIIFVFVFAPLQYYFGMTGLALTELGLLACTLLAVKLTGQSFREVFPIRKPVFSQLMGTLLLWGGCFLLTMLCTLILIYFFPEGYLQVSTGMNSVFATVPAPLRLLIIAVMPAVCEEAMHRGYIQYSFQSVRNDWITILSMGLIFGLFHMDPYRFLPTAILGIGLSYVMQRTHNLLLPALFHFINNFISFLSTLSSSPESLDQSASLFSDHSYILLAIGSYLIIGALAPILLFSGRYLLCRDSNSLPHRSDGRIIASVVSVLSISALMLIAGVIIVLYNINAADVFTEMPVF